MVKGQDLLTLHVLLPVHTLISHFHINARHLMKIIHRKSHLEIGNHIIGNRK